MLPPELRNQIAANRGASVIDPACRSTAGATRTRVRLPSPHATCIILTIGSRRGAKRTRETRRVP